MKTLATCACVGLMVLGLLLYRVDVNQAGGLIYTSSHLMAEAKLWQWGIASIIAGVLGLVLIACAEELAKPREAR